MIEVFYDIVQGTPEWLAARIGIPTASEFATVLAKGKDGGASVTRRKYLYRLAGEILTGAPEETYSNPHMDRGHVLESEARNLYALLTDTEPRLCGFIRNGDKGCSPDGLIDDNGMLEIKTRLPSLMVELLLKGEVPPEHKAQIQGGLWVSEREWLDFIAYYPKMRPFVKRAYRDEPYISRIAEAVEIFNAELHEIVERVRCAGQECEA